MLSRVCLFAISWTAAHQASLSDTTSQSLLKLMSIELGMSSNHLILCHPLLLLPSIFPSIRAFCNESVLCIRWPKVLELQHQSFKRTFRIYLGLTDLIFLPSKGFSRVFSITTVQKHQFFGAHPSSQSKSHIRT